MNDIVTRNNYISKLKRHNEKALEFVVQEYGGQVKAAVYKNLSGMPEEIEECMDDVFLDVWNNIDRFDEQRLVQKLDNGNCKIQIHRLSEKIQQKMFGGRHSRL